MFRLYVVRFGSDVYRFIFATKRMSPEIDRGFREAVGTFRRMTLAESQAARRCASAWSPSSKATRSSGWRAA